MSGVPPGPHLATPTERERYYAAGWWSGRGLVAELEDHAAHRPGELAYVADGVEFDWSEMAAASRSVAAALRAREVRPGSRVAVLLPDSPIVHAVYLGIERADCIIVGIGPRAGRREVEHVLSTTGAEVLIAPRRFRDHDLESLVREVIHDSALELLLPVDGTGHATTIDGIALVGREPAGSTESTRHPDGLFMLNTTSGTTGMPKVVTHTINRWRAFHRLAVEAGELTAGDVFMSVIPAPYGFGIWTAHSTPILLGAPCVVMERFDAAGMLAAIERHGVSVLAAVSTQFIMALHSPELERHDLSSLRVLFTGGEAVPYDRAARFEDVTGAKVLQFFGSNETGALSVTTTRDDRDRRLRTAGRIIDVMNVRLFDDAGDDVTEHGGPGQPACRGPVTCLGYLGDAAATEQLVRPDGWMLTGDIVSVDDEGYLRVVGRTSDFIIRGGKNVSAPAVEAAVAAVPGVAMVAAVAAPSDVFGERVVVYVVPEPQALVDLDTICADLDARDVSKEMWPEFFVKVDTLPMSSGGKVAKSDLRADAARRVASGDLAT